MQRLSFSFPCMDKLPFLRPKTFRSPKTAEVKMFTGQAIVFDEEFGPIKVM